MSDTIDALARALQIVTHDPVWHRNADAVAIAAALTAEGLSIVKTADWERVREVYIALSAWADSDNSGRARTYARTLGSALTETP